MTFLAVGLLLYGARQATTTQLEAPRNAGVDSPIELDASRLVALRRQVLMSSGRLPTTAELASLTRAELDDELLFRDALARGLHRDDTVVRRRLAANLRFLAVADTDAPERSLVDEAFSLGMHRSDVVVRRRLINRMKLEVAAEARQAAPSDAQLADYLRRNRGEFEIPARVGVVQVYFSPRKHGAALSAVVEQALARLRSGEQALADAGGLGDAFLVAARLSPRTRSQLAGDLGTGFAQRVFTLTPQRWYGPIESSYGVHLVYVYETQGARLPRLEEVRERVSYALLAERSAALLAERLDRLRTHYRVVAHAKTRHCGGSSRGLRHLLVP